MLAAEIDESGLAQDLHVAESVGLGLDEKAMEAVNPSIRQSRLSSRKTGLS